MPSVMWECCIDIGFSLGLNFVGIGVYSTPLYGGDISKQNLQSEAGRSSVF